MPQESSWHIFNGPGLWVSMRLAQNRWRFKIPTTRKSKSKNFYRNRVKKWKHKRFWRSALEEHFGGLALMSVSATTQMKTGWGDHPWKRWIFAYPFSDGVKRGITAMLVSVAGAHDVTSKSGPSLLRWKHKKPWGAATIKKHWQYYSRYIMGGPRRYRWRDQGALIFAGKAILNPALRLAMDGSYLSCVSYVPIVDLLIVSPIEGLV